MHHFVGSIGVISIGLLSFVLDLSLLLNQAVIIQLVKVKMLIDY